MVGEKLLTLTMMVICGWPILAPTALAQEVDIIGNYSVQGSSAGGGSYEGVAEITEQGEVYNVTWSVGNVEYEGIGLVEDDLFAVSYLSNSTTGVILYKIEDDQLVGRWADLGSQEFQAEILTRETP